MKSKNIFDPEDITFVEGYYIVSNNDTSNNGNNSDDDLDIESYSGPSIEEVKTEINRLREDWEEEYQRMFSTAQEHSQNLVSNAKEEAKKIIESANKMKDEIIENANKSVSMITKNAEEQSKLILNNAETQSEMMKQDGYKKGMDLGSEDGYKIGRAEAERMIERLGVVISSISRKRIEIIDELENQIIELVLQISRKVVKVISENQESVVISNVDQALKKLRTKTNITIRVNLKDLDIVTAHKKDFIEKIENISNVAIIEDSSIEPGGCIIETDFGELDARISSQLSEIEKTIIDLAPIKSKGISYNFK